MFRFWLRLTLALLLPTASAATSYAHQYIRVESPSPGSLSDVRPTITIAFGGFNLDGGSFRVLVGGADWTSKFNRTAASATYTVTGADELVSPRRERRARA